MPNTLRVLHVEDSESDFAMIMRVLGKAGYDVQGERVEDAAQMRGALARGTWDIVIADYNLPQFDAFAALAILREVDGDLPFIVLSGSIGEDLAVELMRFGAHDYVLKDRIARLVPAIQRELREAESRRERRRAEARVHDRESWLALATEVAGLGMFDHYPATGEIIWSETAMRHFGLLPGIEVDRDALLQLVHPDDRERVGHLVLKAFDPQSGGDYSAEYRAIGLSDRIERYLSVRGRVYFDSRGRPVRFVGVTSDLTARKQLEDQFRQAQKLESLGRLAGGVAHDFNNLLTVINGYSQMTLDTLSAEHPLREGLEEILKAGMRAIFLTRQLLAFSRRRPIKTETIIINDLLADLRKMLERLVGEDVELVFNSHPAAGAIRADAGHLEQVVMNLIVNARDAMPHGGKVFIETGRFVVDEAVSESPIDVAPGQYAALTVRDTGHGMPPEVKARLFEPFFTTKEEGKGTGLGLSTVYGIVKQCGGSISVESDVGRGTTFRIFFPATESQSVETSAAAPADVFAGTEMIVVAEDQDEVRRFVSALLREQGYRVLECSNGRDAIELSNSHSGPIHLLITDAVMPEMNGPELAAEFAALRPGVPILHMSGYNELPGARLEESTNYIQKPFSPLAILTRVRTLLDAARQKNDSANPA
jgi:signal transduction histidine kinase/DNA-binding response OmpR family regulator